jgi:cationic amino acid transporter 2
MPRIVMAMANDGVVFKFLGKVLKKCRTPYVASIFTGGLAGKLANKSSLT